MACCTDKGELMAEWRPITKRKLEDLICTQLPECTPEQKDAFEKYRVPFRQAAIERYGKSERVFVVAQRGNEVMYYEDVEQGFNFSPEDAEGKILEHWCDQDELKHALWHWTGRPKQGRRGPAKPPSSE